MIDIAIALYVVSFLSNVAKIANTVLIVTMCVLIASPFGAFVYHDLRYSIQETVKPLMVKAIKIFVVTCFVPSVLAVALIPNERTVHDCWVIC